MSATHHGLPPGPRLPRAVQTIGFMFAGPRFIDACRRRYGDAVTFGTLFDERFVMVFHPALIKELFQGPPEQLRAGEANVMLGPIVGERSVLLLDGTEHLRHRKLLLGPFHGRQMQANVDAMRASADLEIDSWPVGEPFSLLPSMQSLTLRVILRAVFGYEPGAEEVELRRRLRAMLEPLSRPRAMMLLAALPFIKGDQAAVTAQFERARKAVDEVLYAEIARRRADPGLDQRNDIFSALLLAEDEDGERLSDREVRDELVTLLLAGHETTATGLAWTFDLLLHDAAARHRARQGDERYLDAVVKESLRLRPVIPGVGRVVRGEPFRLNGYEVPPGVEINPSIRVMHRREDLFPDSGAFRPERFLVEDPPDTYTWIPFGGGTRRCLGASFALVEMRIVVARVLERAALRAADPKHAKVQFRGITLAPRDGVRVIQDRAPAPAT
jgi:cytochrome P450